VQTHLLCGLLYCGCATAVLVVGKQMNGTGDRLMADNNIEKSKQELIAEIDKRICDKIIEPTNADLLKKLICNADTLTEAISIASLGTTYKRTGFHFDKRLEKMGDTIKYFKKNEGLSFQAGNDAMTHKLIVGDNYDALLNLLVEYRGRVDVIYIDPPYGKDSMGEFAEVNYDNAITRDNLLSMLYSRLVLARQLLSDSGVIFCSIDDKNQAYVKCLFDEVFEERNFCGQIIWRKKRGGGQADEFFVTEHESILVYRKGSGFKWSDEIVPVSESVFNKEDGVGKYSAVKLEKWGNTARKEDRPTMYFSIASPDGKNIYPIAPDGSDGRWRVGKARMEQIVKNDAVHWENKGGRWIPYEKVYATGEDVRVLKSRSIFYDVAETGDGSNRLTEILGKKDVFSNPKPVEVLKELIQHAKNDIVLDFFAGSGTTGQAVLELNAEDGGSRQFILATSNEVTSTTPNGIAKDVTSKRLKRVMTGKCYDGTDNFKWLEKNKPLGDSLDVYDIDTVANFEMSKGKTPFDVIDETLYGQEKLGVSDKIKWVCENFDGTQNHVESDDGYKSRVGGE